MFNTALYNPPERYMNRGLTHRYLGANGIFGNIINFGDEIGYQEHQDFDRFSKEVTETLVEEGRRKQRIALEAGELSEDQSEYMKSGMSFDEYSFIQQELFKDPFQDSLLPEIEGLRSVARVLFDPKEAEGKGIVYDNKKGKDISLKGFGIDRRDYYGKGPLEAISFPELRKSHIIDQVVINTEYIRAVNRGIFLDEDIDPAIREYKGEEYLVIISSKRSSSMSN